MSHSSTEDGGVNSPSAAVSDSAPGLPDLISGTNNLDLTGDDFSGSDYNHPPMGFTENLSATYLSSGNPCLDFFFHVVPNTPAGDVANRLKSSWAHNPLTTLKLICNLRGVRGSGKSDKESFYTAALWLHENHPKTLAQNVALFAEFGYFKDLLEILCRILEGPELRLAAKEQWRSQKEAKGKVVRRKSYFLAKKERALYGSDDISDDETSDYEISDGEILDYETWDEEKEIEWRLKFEEKQRKRMLKLEEKKKRKRLEKEKKKLRLDEEKKRLRASEPREQRIAANMAKVKAEKEKARALRKEKDAARAKKALERYNTDLNYQFLHDQISGLFAELLKSDVENLKSGEINKISLAGKWCPTVDSSYDKYTLICQSIAKKMFPLGSDAKLNGMDEAQYVNKVKDQLRKEVLVPLHKALKLPEVYMSAKEWTSLQYDRIASVAMKNYTDIFLHRDNKRFRDYLENVKVGKSKIAAGALLPHEIIASSNGSSGAAIVADLQWKRMVEDLLNKGKLTNCIAVCDVSGSMSGTPMEVSVALGLLVSELSEEPWKGHVITFSEDPQLHLIEGTNLRSKTQFVKRMDWGGNTDFQRVFDRILGVAVNGNLSEDKMVKRVFVFSDMEFDMASSNPWETDYQVIQRKFREKGFQKVPEIVFWNLRDSSSTPVTATQNGVALVSGYSKNLLTLFLEEGGLINPEDVTNTEDVKKKPEGGEMNPEATMEAAISGELFQKLVVYD